jgi:hypothetical protein
MLAYISGHVVGEMSVPLGGHPPSGLPKNVVEELVTLKTAVSVYLSGMWKSSLLHLSRKRKDYDTLKLVSWNVADPVVPSTPTPLA